MRRKTANRKYGASMKIKYGNAYHGSNKVGLTTILFAVAAILVLCAIAAFWFM